MDTKQLEKLKNELKSFKTTDQLMVDVDVPRTTLLKHLNRMLAEGTVEKKIWLKGTRGRQPVLWRSII